ncbi:MAG: hypothetical protein J6W73_00080, partial [Verrucomicrobia bacterium]|nr:hypothetical protein [Verrucomicrobiota bacterium]
SETSLTSPDDISKISCIHFTFPPVQVTFSSLISCKTSLEAPCTAYQNIHRVTRNVFFRAIKSLKPRQKKKNSKNFQTFFIFRLVYFPCFC